LATPNELSQYANKFTYCAAFYIRKEFRDGKIDRGLIEYAVNDLAKKGYKYLLIDEMIDQLDINSSELYNLRFLLANGWKEIERVFPDDQRTNSQSFPHMNAERKKLEYGTIWLGKEIAL
jgi:hypothetical protein